MKKIYSIIAFLSISFFSFAQTFPINFETTGHGATWTWTVFENGITPPPLEIVANPDPTGINTSSTVAKFTAIPTGTAPTTLSQQFAGFETSHGSGVGTFSIDTYNAKIKIMVYKNKISDVGLKLVTASNAAYPPIKVANTVINQWEELTFDFYGHRWLNPYDKLVIFPDWSSRSADEIIYIDNISFTCMKTNNPGFTVNSCAPYTAPSGKIYSNAGTYQDTIQSIGGCDSIFPITVTKNDIVGQTITVNTCSPYTAPSGAIFTKTGTFTDIITGFRGCDSVNTIVLNMTDVIEDQTVIGGNVALCSGESATISLSSSQTGVNYYLRNSADNTIVDGPVAGTNSSISFNTGNLTTTTIYNVSAESSALLLKNVGSLVFNGDFANQKVTLGTALWDDNFVGQNQLTVEAWVKRTVTKSFHTIVGNYQSTYPLLVRLDNSKLSFYMNSGTSITSANPVPLNAWTHIAATYDGANMKVYINGVLEATTPLIATFTSTTEPMKIGGGLSNNTEYFQGSIGDVRIWKTAKTQAELSASMTSILNGNETNLIAYYRFSEGAGNTVANSTSITSYTGTLVNSPTWNTNDLQLKTLTLCNEKMSSNVAVVTIDPELCTVGIDDVAFGKNITLFPNPSNGQFSIELGSVEKSLTVRIMSIAGQIVEEHSFENTNRINIATQQPAGIYFIELTNADSNKAVLKMIKE